MTERRAVTEYCDRVPIDAPVLDK